MKTLEEYRKQIDKVDQQLLKNFARRFQIVKKIGQLKKKLNLPPLDKKRWQKVLTSRIKIGEKLGLSKNFIEKIYQLIHSYSLELERK